KVLVTGGAGYKGCILIPKLLAADYAVVVYDLMLTYDRGLPEHANLEVVTGDIRDVETYSRAVEGCDAVIHMACISNDPSFELDSRLSKAVNYDCFEPLVRASRNAGVKRFVYVSSSSVYGVSDAPNVTEDHPLVPLTDYNKYKGLCEPILLKYQSPEFTTVIFRPATVCGYSPRMRFDLSINILTNHAVNQRMITVFGGKQKRPNIHIEDVTDVYLQSLQWPTEKLGGEIFNVGYENHTIEQLANFVKGVVEDEFPEKKPIPIRMTESNDNRSYHVNSDKITKVLGWRPKRTIEDAVRDLCKAFKREEFPDSLSNDKYSNVKTIKGLVLV
ncbi:MAG: UDP-glucose 4-epimerase, partial [Verrucomicrobia bacterium]